MQPSFTPLGPVAVSERIAAVDVLRGFSLLGILVINIDFFALPSSIYFNPEVWGGFSGLNLLSWKFGSLFFLQKMMAIFSMLFGAGLVLMNQRAESVKRKFGGIYYRRILWLLLFGLAHGYLFWHGDILFTYAVCGLLLFPLRRRSPKFLIGLGIFILLFGVFIQMGSGWFFHTVKKEAMAAQAAVKAGEVLSSEQKGAIEAWEEMSSGFDSSAEKVAEEIETYHGGYLDIFRHRFPQTLMMQTQALIFMVLWRVLGLMLLGMGLMKLEVFSAERSKRFYLVFIIVGYGIGLPLCAYGINSLLKHGFDFIYRFKIGGHYNYLGSVLVALGHTGVVMLVCKSGILSWLTQRLSAVGRMALSNYLLHTLICTTIFYGYGLGLFGRIQRFGLFMIVIAIWILQLILSPLWLKHFRFGPAEWLWRTLTYWRRQPMKIANTST
ncbi:MAG: hypothetical protein AMJ90_05845 [candidate division Zixibacteria bacterium SM23_73_2]|nr:MAG: hypothetical protein AMJ90_05845 [candidate division Zixibacteria bacterium SM23_73_2]